MATEDEWIAVLGASATEEEASRTLRDGAARFHEVLERHPMAFDRVHEILSTRLEQLDAESWGTVQSCLLSYLGVDGAYLIGWLVSDLDRENQLEGFASPDVAFFVRQLLALHGPELETAFAVWREFPDNWKGMRREVFLDQLTGLYRIQLYVSKFNGDEVMFEGPPDSFLKMARNILVTLQGVAPGFYNAEVLDEFVQDARDFLASVDESQQGAMAGGDGEAALVPAPSPEVAGPAA